jgi:hypothetical protein
MTNFTEAVLGIKAWFAKMLPRGELIGITFTFNTQGAAQIAKSGMQRAYRYFELPQEQILTLCGVRLRFKFVQTTEGEV